MCSCHRGHAQCLDPGTVDAMSHVPVQSMLMQKNKRGWRDGSAVKSSAALVEEFSSQHPHSSLQPYVTLVTRDLMSSFGFDSH